MKKTITYVSSNPEKKLENAAYMRVTALASGEKASDLFEFEFIDIDIKEILDVSIEKVAEREVIQAYANIRIPCIVEHAGLIFEEFRETSRYPGGLTKAMWNSLGEEFVKETGSAGRRAIAKAVIAYCDGAQVKCFIGERSGTIAKTPRGTRKFYWDTIFEPETEIAECKGLTYAEIVEDPRLGIDVKMKGISQSAIAMTRYLEYLLSSPNPKLWP